MIYQILLAVGALGVFVLGLSGFRGGRSGHGRGHRHGKTQARGRGRGRGKGQADSGAFLDAVLGMFSPLGIFALCLGAGAAGMVTQRWWAALLGALLFWKLVIEPLQELLLRFASEPAKNLEGSRATEAIAQSRFDSRGQGMVSLTVDGQVRRILATLSEGEASAITVGDKLVVVDVDTKHNTCRVAPL